MTTSSQAGGDVHDSSTSASGHRLEVSATRRYFRLMCSRSVYTPREPAAGGDNSTPAPVQDYVLSSTPIPPTAAKVGGLTIFDFATLYICRPNPDVKGYAHINRKKLDAPWRTDVPALLSAPQSPDSSREPPAHSARWMTHSARSMPAGAGRMPAGAGWVPAGAGWMPAGAGWMPAGAGRMPAGAGWMRQVPVRCRQVPDACRQVPVGCRQVPVRCRQVPDACRQVPVRCRQVPVGCRQAPDGCRQAPDGCRPVPVRCRQVPVRCRQVPDGYLQAPDQCRQVPVRCRQVPRVGPARTFQPRTTAHPRIDRVNGRTAGSGLGILRVAQNDRSGWSYLRSICVICG